MSESFSAPAAGDSGIVAPVHLRLYVAGEGPNSVAARQNLRTLCECHLQDRCSVEIVDLLRQPERAISDGILVTPTLVRLSPAPVARVVGTLSRPEAVVPLLGIEGPDHD